MAKPKLIIHETDSPGVGAIYYKGNTYNYTYEDSRCGDIMLAISFLIEIGFINEKDVLRFFECDKKDADTNIYSYLNKLIEATEK